MDKTEEGTEGPACTGRAVQDRVARDGLSQKIPRIPVSDRWRELRVSLEGSHWQQGTGQALHELGSRP